MCNWAGVIKIVVPGADADVDSLTLVLNLTASSRASPLPQGFAV